jgi:hypothetical protein
MRSRAATWSPDWLLDLLEPGWTSRLRGRSLIAEAKPEVEVLEAVARPLGVYPATIAAWHWPACLAFAVTGVAATAYHDGSAWRTWWRERGKRAPAAADAASCPARARRLHRSRQRPAGTGYGPHCRRGPGNAVHRPPGIAAPPAGRPGPRKWEPTLRCRRPWPSSSGNGCARRRSRRHGQCIGLQHPA